MRAKQVAKAVYSLMTNFARYLTVFAVRRGDLEVYTLQTTVLVLCEKKVAFLLLSFHSIFTHRHPNLCDENIHRLGESRAALEACFQFLVQFFVRASHRFRFHVLLTSFGEMVQTKAEVRKRWESMGNGG